MQNLIRNDHWQEVENGWPRYFSPAGATFDDLCICGFRTCSITQETGADALTQYDLPVPVRPGAALCWGFCIRAVEAEEIALTATFYDAEGNLLQTLRQPITPWVEYQFTRQMARFIAPAGAAKAELALAFSGRVTACTYYAPQAYMEGRRPVFSR